MALMGHTQLRTTQGYGHVVGDDKREAVERVGRLLPAREHSV
jgi:hypothetical protein